MPKCQFDFHVLHFQSSSLLMPLEKQQNMDRVSEPLTPKQIKHAAPGSRLANTWSFQPFWD